MTKILCCGDMHFREKLGYDSLVPGGRDKEREEILSFIVDKSRDCDAIVLLGDNFNFKNNPSSVIKSFIEFLERFGDKEIYILAGNHEKWGDGRSAIDFINEIHGKTWFAFVNKVGRVGNMTFLPYMNASEVEATNVSEWQNKIMDMLKPNDVLFMHHTISGSSLHLGSTVDEMITREPVLPYRELGERYKMVFGGHIHTPSVKQALASRIITTGSVFANEAGDTTKYIYKLDTEKFTYEDFVLPGRCIYSLHNPTIEEIQKLKSGNIVKVKLTQILSDVDREKLDKELTRFDAHIVVEDIPHARIQSYADSGRNILELDINELLTKYAEQRGVDATVLQKAFEMVK